MKLSRDELLKKGSFLVVFVLPIIFFGHTLWYPYNNAQTFVFYGLVEILAAVWVYTMIVDSSYRLSKKNWLYFVPLGAYVAWMTVAGIFGVNPALSFWSTFARDTGLLTLYHCFLFAIIISSLVKRNGVTYLYKLFEWFLYGGFILGISIWLGSEGFNVWRAIQDSQGGGLNSNSSFAAAYLLFVMVFGFFLLTVETIPNKKKWFIGAMLSVILFSPIYINVYGLFSGAGLLGSARGATLGIFIIIGVSFLFYLFFSKKKSVKYIGIIGMVVGIVVFSIGWIQLMNPNTSLHEKFVRSVSSTRFIFWSAGQKAINEHPWFGYGPENFMFAFQKNFDPKITITGNLLDKHSNELWVDRAHNIYIDTGVSGGYPAIFLYGLYLLSILFVLYEVNRLGTTISRFQSAILGGLLIGYTFQNLFVFDSIHSLAALFVLAGIIFALQDSTNKNKNQKKVLNIGIKNSLIVLLTAVCVLEFIFFVYRPLRKDITINDVGTMWVNERPDHYKDLMGGSSMGDQLDISDMADRITIYYATNMVSIKQDKKYLPYAINDLTALSQYLETATLHNKTDSRLYFNLFKSYIITIFLTDKPYDPVLAQHLLDILNYQQKLSPTNPMPYYGRAQVYIWKGDLKAIENEYRNEIALDPSVPDFHNNLIQFAEETGNVKLYNEAVLEAQKNMPGFSFKN